MYIPLIKIKISIKKYTRDDSKMCPTPTPHPRHMEGSFSKDPHPKWEAEECASLLGMC